MKTFDMARIVAKQHFLSWRSNDRILILFGLTALLICFYIGRLPFYGMRTGQDNTLFLLPFLFTISFNANGSLKVLLLFAVILLFSEAPFLNSQKIYLIIRSRRKAWWIGECLYIASASMLYMLFLVLLTMLLALPNATWNGWGETILTGVFGSPVSQNAIWYAIYPDARLIIGTEPFPAFLFTFFSGWLFFIWLGLLIDCINLFTGKDWPGVSAAALVVLIDPVLRWFGESVDVLFLFSPASWITLSTMRSFSGHGVLTTPLVLILLIAEDLILTFLVAHRSRKLDIATWKGI